MLKSLALQASRGPIFDVTLDCEDGAAAGHEVEHAHLVAQLLAGDANLYGRVGIRVHAVDHRAFLEELKIILGFVGAQPKAWPIAYIAIPKVNSALDVANAAEAIARISAVAKLSPPPMHVLIETHGALREVFRIAAHPQVQCLSFGLMDFVSAHRGAIAATAMTAIGQFSHPLIVRAKLEISAACHAYGKTPSHNVVTELDDVQTTHSAALQARELGYQRMWRIHPKQIEPIIDGFSPRNHEIADAERILVAAYYKQWGPIRDGAILHDKASYRYYWDILKHAWLKQHVFSDLTVELFFKHQIGSVIAQ